ncbi:MAG: DUF1800 family protein [Planctomycetota bacterium]
MSKTLTEAAAVGHLLRRAGFGASPSSLEEFRRLGFVRGVDRLLEELDAPPPEDPEGFDPYVPGAIQQRWLERMISGRAMLAEKLAFFWHGHFATSNTKIQDPRLMWLQYRLLRGKGAGGFRELVEGVSRDVAMIRWLDGNANRRGVPNENYARELQELFTLGIGNYTEQDVRELARAFTGWGSRHHTFVFTDRYHDGGHKTVHGKTGRWDGDDVIRIITDLPACRRFIATKLLRFFSHPEPAPGEVDAVAAVLQKTDGRIEDALRAVFLAGGFRARSHFRMLVRSPVEFIVGAFRATGIDEVLLWAHGALERMGQILFRPPSVKGWTSGSGWLGSAAMVERLKAARRIAETAAPEAAPTIVDVALDGEVPPELASLLEDARGRERIVLVLGSPEYQLS